MRFKTEADEHSDNLVASQPWPRTLSYPEDVAQRLRNVAGFVTPDGRFVRQ